MPEETPNQSEERLQRYAKERRAQGGDFALHPATRQMLQGEVARTLGAKESAAKSRGWFSWLNSWSGRIAIGTTAVVVITGSWILWHNQLDRHAMQFARAEMPVRKSELAGQEGSRNFVAAPKAEKELAMTAAAPGPQPVTLLAATTSPKADNDAGKIAADKMTVVDALAKNSSVAAYQEQLSAASQLANDTTLSLAPVAQKSYGAIATDAPKPDGRNQQTFNYANAAGQNMASAGQAAANVADRYQNQAGQALGGALAYANNEPKRMKEADAAFQAQNSAPESRARGMRSDLSDIAAVAAPAIASEPQSRAAISASGAAAKSDDAPTRFYRLADNAKDVARTKTLTAPALAEPVLVLNDFVIEQRGTTVRLVDADGSVYDGALETPPSASFVPAQALAGGPVREVFPGDKSETAPRHQELSFRAAGSNVTLRQLVVVNGRFSPGTDTAHAGRATPAEAPSKQRDLAARRATPQTAQASNIFAGQYGAATNATSTIEGTVRIGTTNQQWFRATRRGP